VSGVAIVLVVQFLAPLKIHFRPAASFARGALALGLSP
jgi:hypothetical protein